MDHPDTAAGARAALAEMSALTPKQLGQARFAPDPQVAGTWAAFGAVPDEPEAPDVVIYLAGHGPHRTNDFEQCKITNPGGSK